MTEGCGAIRRWEVNCKELTLLNHHCCLCGLLCPVPMRWPNDSERHLPECERLRGWLSDQDAHGIFISSSDEPEKLAERLAHHADELARARNPLLWIESGDVSATRAAVRLAESCQATVHVAESPGAHNVSLATCTSGMFGTSLAEVWQHADVLVHIGHQHLQELPLLTSRFLTSGGVGQSPSGRHHVFIDDDLVVARQYAQRCAAHDEGSGGMEMLEWPRALWLERFTELLLALRGNNAWAHTATNTRKLEETGILQIAELLAGSRYAVIMWGEDQFADEADRMLVERLLEIAAKITEVTRCSLLPLGVDPGRTTAKETLLWLTNYATTACFTDGHWRKPHLADNVGLDDWHREHDWILGVRTLPSDRPLPNLKFDLVLDAACNYPLHPVVQSSASTPADVIAVAAVGLECSGHVTRIDHAFGAYVRALSASDPRRPTAAELMAELAKKNQAAGGQQC